jgi:SSS family solute:Na+ symporter
MDTFLVLLSLYIVGGTAVAVMVHRRGQTHEDYYIGGRKISGLVSAFTYSSTTYSAFMMVGLVGLSFQTGIGALIFEITYLIGTLLLLSIYGKRIWHMSRKHGFVSPVEIFSHRYGRETGTAAAIVAVLALIPYTSSQVIGLALILQSFGGFGYILGVGFAVVIISLWAIIGGLRGVAVTDALQGGFMILAALLGLTWSWNRFGGLQVQQFPSDFWTASTFVNFTLPWFFFALTNPQVMQRLFIPRDEKSLRRMIVYFGLFGFVYTVIVTLIGFMARHGAITETFPMMSARDDVILEIMHRMAGWFSIPLALSIIFASVSTANSIILTLSSMVVRDLFRDREHTWVGRMFILAISAVVFLFAITRPNYVVELSVASSSILLPFVPLLFGVFHWRHGKQWTGVATLVTGAGVAIVMRAFRVPFGALYTFIFSFFIFFMSSFLERNLKNE